MLNKIELVKMKKWLESGAIQDPSIKSSLIDPTIIELIDFYLENS